MIARIARRIAEKGSGSSSRRFSRRPWQAESNAESQQRKPGTLRGQELEERDKKMPTAEADSGAADRLARKIKRLLI
jgi:hypothetical protein